MRVLLADGNLASRTIQKKLLAELGLKDITEADSAKAALADLGKSRFNLLITSDRLDDATGVDLTTKVRPSRKELPIIMVSANGTLPFVAQAVKAGVSNFIVKPFGHDLYKDKVSRTLKLGEPTDEKPAPDQAPAEG